MVKAGSTMWKPSVKANCARARMIASATEHSVAPRACPRGLADRSIGDRPATLGRVPYLPERSCVTPRTPTTWRRLPSIRWTMSPGIAFSAIST